MEDLVDRLMMAMLIILVCTMPIFFAYAAIEHNSQGEEVYESGRHAASIGLPVSANPHQEPWSLEWYRGYVEWIEAQQQKGVAEEIPCE